MANKILNLNKKKQTARQNAPKLWQQLNLDSNDVGQVYGIKNGAYLTKFNGEMLALKPRGRIQLSGERVLVGDFVKVNKLSLTIEEILPRKTELIRPKVANVDQLLICVTISPEADLFLVDNLLILAKQSNITPIILITKSDLNVSGFKERIFANFAPLGVKILSASSICGVTNELTELLSNKTTAIAGQSGVGKSSLINSLASSLNLKTNELSRLNRGRNTTASSFIYEVGSAKILDTPGFSVVNAGVNSPAEFLTLFPDISPFSKNCKYLTCNHLDKPVAECGVLQALEAGKINKERFARFISSYKFMVGLEHKNYKKHKPAIKK